jgi:hypothetical protein
MELKPKVLAESVDGEHEGGAYEGPCPLYSEDDLAKCQMVVTGRTACVQNASYRKVQTEVNNH